MLPLLRRRGESLLVRRSHGDLHLGNIALIDGKPVLFDAIEFDPLVASGDVLYDLAFLLMDLVERGLPRPANTVLNRYIAETKRDRDLDGLGTLPFFMSMRAAIRAKVTAAKRDHADDTDKGGIEESAKAYFQLALRLISPPPPQLIAVGGLSGTGKSVLARMLAADIEPMPGAIILRSDTLRKTLFDFAETEKLPEQAYTAAVTAKVYAILSERALRVLRAGHSAIVDAVFAKADERTNVWQRPRRPACRFAGSFSRRISKPASRGSVRGLAMRPTPMPMWRDSRPATISARSTGSRSMPRARRRTRWREPRRRFQNEPLAVMPRVSGASSRASLSDWIARFRGR